MVSEYLYYIIFLLQWQLAITVINTKLITLCAIYLYANYCNKVYRYCLQIKSRRYKLIVKASVKLQ